MKNTVLLLATLSAFMLNSCKQKELDQAIHQKDSLSTYKDSLLAVLMQRDSALTDFINTFDEVEKNLDSVAVRQQIIARHTEAGSTESQSNRKERINQGIHAINSLMEENRLMLDSLTDKLKSTGMRNSTLEKMVNTMRSQIANKDEELNVMHEKLNSLNFQVTQLKTSVDTLTTLSATQAKTIADEIAIKHTAYYIIGRRKFLEDSKLINSKGGLLGLGNRTSSLNDNFNTKRFKKIDYTVTTSFPVNSEEVKLVTNHPSDSYRFDRDNRNIKMVKTLVITDPEKFWSVSKYLVVAKD